MKINIVQYGSTPFWISFALSAHSSGLPHQQNFHRQMKHKGNSIPDIFHKTEEFLRNDGDSLEMRNHHETHHHDACETFSENGM